MATFQPIRNRFESIGIRVYRKFPLNFRNLLTLFMLSSGAVLNSAHLLYEAKTFKEFADSVCATVAMITASTLFVVFIWKTLSFYDCFDKMERSISKREL